MPYFLIQILFLALWYAVPALAAVPLWVVFLPLGVILMRLLVLIGVVVVAAVVAN